MNQEKIIRVEAIEFILDEKKSYDLKDCTQEELKALSTITERSMEYLNKVGKKEYTFKYNSIYNWHFAKVFSNYTKINLHKEIQKYISNRNNTNKNFVMSAAAILADYKKVSVAEIIKTLDLKL